MGVLTINELAMQAFSVSSAVESWRDLIIKEQQARTQTLIETEYVRSAESYARTTAADSYARQAAQNSYARRSAVNSYSRSSAVNSYARQTAENSYSRSSARDSYSRSLSVDSYSRRSAQNYYSESAYSNSYSRASGLDSYSRSTGTDSYSRTTGQNSYSRRSASNSYSRTTAANSYSRKTAANYYSRTAALDSYSRTEMQDSYSRSLFRNSYSRSALQNTYTRQAAQNYYSRQAAQNSYSRTAAANSYSRQSYANSYSRQTAQNSYSRSSAQNSYSRSSAQNSYSRSSAVNSYTRRSAQNSYSRANSTYRRLGITRYSRANSYSRSSAQNYYSRSAARNSYSRSSAQNSYSRSSAQNSYSRSSAQNSYSRATGQNSYTRQTATSVYTRTAALNSYTRTDAQNSYSRVAHVDSHTDGYYNNTGRAAIYIDYYSRAALQDYYSRRTATNYYVQQTALDSYSRTSAANSYTRLSAQNSYTRTTSADSYARQTAVNSYSRSSATNYYSRSSGSDYYGRSSAVNSYSEASGVNSYARASAENSYSRSAALDSYSRSAARNSYSRSETENYYLRAVKVDTYSRSAAIDEYTPAKDSGFDHKNYIPSSPAVYDLAGSIVTGELDIRLASYDKNADGYGDQDADSINIKYNVLLRRTEDENGAVLSESESPYVVIASNVDSPDLNFDVSSYEDGQYRLSTVALNVPRGDQKYESAASYTDFTIMNSGLGADLTILNSGEFYDYIYGIETYVNRADEIKSYADNVLYGEPASQTQQKGLFLVIDLKDEDTDTYHSVKAGLKKGGSVVTPTIYDVVFSEGNTAGDKTGYVFIPLSSMLTGDFSDVNIELELTEYYDSSHAKVKGKTETTLGVSALKDVIYIGIDSNKPAVNISTPKKKAIKQDITIECSDSGLGIKEFYYQVVNKGASVSESGWIKAGGTSKTIEFNNSGTYDLYARAVDMAGNETTEVARDIEVAFINVDVDSPRVTKPGDSFTVETVVTTDLDVTDIKYWLQDDAGNKISPVLRSETDLGDYTKYIYEGDMSFDDGTTPGQYYICVEVTLSDGNTVDVTKPIRVVESYGEIVGEDVSHTPEWEAHRLEYNDLYDPDRGQYTFWAGEGFVVSADIDFEDIDTVNEGCLLETVSIVGTEYAYDFTEYIDSGQFLSDITVDPDGKVHLHQEGLLWDEKMISDWGEGAVLTFEFTFTDGTVAYKTVTVDRTTEYFLYHRKK